MAKTKRARDLTLRDLLSRIEYRQACKLLGADGAQLLREGGKLDVDPTDHVRFSSRELAVCVADATVRVTRAEAARGRLLVECSACATSCVHGGAALSLVLEEKMTLGLAAPPRERTPVESLSEEELVQRALDDRAERAA